MSNDMLGQAAIRKETLHILAKVNSSMVEISLSHNFHNDEDIVRTWQVDNIIINCRRLKSKRYGTLETSRTSLKKVPSP